MAKKKHSVQGEPVVKMLDFGQFASLEDAMDKAEPGDRYLNVGSVLLPQAEAGPIPTTLLTFFWMSMLTRSQGLHGAIAREIRHENAHAVFPLLRAFAEAVALVMYVSEHPNYVQALTQRPSEKGAPKRKSVQALISHAAKNAPGLKHVYADLSEAAHFGAVAMWASIRPEDDDGEAGFSWSSHPRWRDDQAYIACAQVIELAEAMDQLLRRFAVWHLSVPERVARSS